MFFSFTTVPGLTPSCAHAMRSQKWDELFCPTLLTAQILYPLSTTCLALWRVHYVDAILQVMTNWNKVFVMCSDLEAGNFTMVVYSVLINTGKSMLKMTGTLWKNSLIIAKDISQIKFHYYCNYIFSEKNWRHYFHTTPCKIQWPVNVSLACLMFWQTLFSNMRL
jgi:hypothetical protein